MNRLPIHCPGCGAALDAEVQPRVVHVYSQAIHVEWGVSEISHHCKGRRILDEPDPSRDTTGARAGGRW